MSLRDVSNILWRERRLLDLLLFKLSEEQLLVAAGYTHWLPLATREIEAVLDELHDAELVRAMFVDRAAEDLGLAAGPNLRELSRAADAPWDDVLAAHHEALRELADRVAAAAHDHRGQLAHGAQAVRARFRSDVMTSRG